ncbi:MAG TPA: hypothetical protein VGN26_14910 [Armatimonadota bacterium]|jgi:ABC-type Fe3+ transport system permease subunit
MTAVKIFVALLVALVVLITLAIEWLRARIREQRRGTRRPGTRRPGSR